MKKLNRRQFLKTSAASLALAQLGVKAKAETAGLLESGQDIGFDGPNYRWEWSAQNDNFRVFDSQGLVIVSGPLQPAVIVKFVRQSANLATAGSCKAIKWKAIEQYGLA